MGVLEEIRAVLGGETVGVPLRRLRRGRRRGVRVLGHGERPASAEGSREDHHGEGPRERRRAGRPERVLEQPGAAGGEGVQRGREQKQPGKHRKMAGKGKGKIGSTSVPIYEREREREMEHSEGTSTMERLPCVLLESRTWRVGGDGVACRQAAHQRTR